MTVEAIVDAIEAAPTWDARITLIRRIPEEFGTAQHQDVYAAVAGRVYVPKLAPDFAYVHWREEYELPAIEAAYAHAHRLTEGFRRVDELGAAHVPASGHLGGGGPAATLRGEAPVLLLDPEVAWRLQQEQERGRAEARGVALVLGTIGAAVAAGIVVTWAYHENGAAPFREDRGDVDISDRVCAEAVAAVLGGVR